MMLATSNLVVWIILRLRRLPDLGQAFELLEAESEELLRFWFSIQPVLGRLEVSPTVFAPKNCGLLLNAFGDVNLRSQAIDTHV